MPIEPLNFEHVIGFDRHWHNLGLTDGDLLSLQNMLILDRLVGSVMKMTGGLRKVRFTKQDSGRGKRGSYRVGYALFPEFSHVLLVVAYGKTEKDNLSLAERKSIASFLDQFDKILRLRYTSKSKQ